MSKKPDKYKAALRDLVDAIHDSDAAREIDAGCNGDGPLANALVALGDFKNSEQATDAIFGEDWRDE